MVQGRDDCVEPGNRVWVFTLELVCQHAEDLGRACDYLGSGFAKLPGTDTCARIGGKVSVETGFRNRSTSSGGQVQLDFETRSN